MIFNKFFILFKIGRKIGKSNIINIISETHKIPIFIKIFFNLLSFTFSSSKDTKSDSKDNLSTSIQEMGTTFIKLGQFLATRPDIIGEKLSKEFNQMELNESGLFGTNDGGENWSSLTDDFAWMAMGTIAFHPVQEGTVYIGSGDPQISSHPRLGDGVHKSTDGGVSWTHLGLDSARIVSKLLILV